MASPSLPRLTRRQDPLVARFRDAARGDVEPDVVLLDGEHVILEALRADVPVEVIVAGPGIWERVAHTHDQFAALARASGATRYDAAQSVLEAMSPVRTPSGMVALARWTPARVDALWSPAPALVLGAVDIQDPGNAGAIIRSADGLDATGVALLGASAVPGGWKALRGAMGSTFRLPVARGSVTSIMEEARTRGAQVVASTSEREPGAREIRDVDLREPVLLLVGNEGAGLSEAALQQADTRVYIAMRPGLDSFNVSVTAGLLLYEARRQRTTR